MTYSFDTVLAEKYGVDSAIILQNLMFWITKNRASEKHFHDGRTWCYNSMTSWATLFPFWTVRQIERILKKLKDNGIIITGNYNLTAYDRTLWYAFYDESIYVNGGIHFTKRVNGNTRKVRPIPDSNQDSNTNEEKRTDALASSRPRFKEPTIEEVSAYCQERANGVSPAKWFAHYEANGWKVGRNSMKDWKAAVRTWEPDGFHPPKRIEKKMCPLCGKPEDDGLCRNPACSQYDEAFRGGKSAGAV